MSSRRAFLLPIQGVETAMAHPQFDYGIEDVPEADDAAIDRWHDGWFDGHGAKPKASDDADYLKGYAEGHEARKVVVVMPERPEGYYHMPLGTFD
tara:strand:- start:180 stop:464 length:285 start_codon:yes stop_codon:yes gene_type:complete